MSRRIVLPLLTILVLSSATLGGLLLSSSPTAWDDGLRHMTMARVMREDGINQTWDRFLYGGYLAEHPVDPWFGADISYIPFTVFEDTFGLKLYAVVALVALLLALWYIITPLQLPTEWNVSLLFIVFIATEFFTRILIARPFVWGTIFALLALDATLRRRWIMLGSVLFLATLFSQLFIFSVAFAVIGTIWLYTLREQRSAMQGIFSVILGVAAGIAVHPHPVNYAVYIAEVFLRIPFETHRLSLGIEMYPGLLESTVPVAILGSLLLLCAGAYTHGLRLKFSDLYRDGTLLIMAMTFSLFVGYLAAWNRMIDLLLPLLILSLARFLKHGAAFARELFAVSLAPLFPRFRGGTVLFSVLLCAAVYSIGDNTHDFRVTQDSRALAHAAPIAALPAGARVLNLEWSYFPLYMRSNPDVRFATGIDNTFMAVADREGFTLLEVMFSPAMYTPRPVIDVRAWMEQLLEHFPSDYLVLSDGWGKHLLPLLRETPGLTPLTESGAKIEVFEIEEGFGQ